MSTSRMTQRYLTLDIWRGIACLMVVLDHAGLVLSGQETYGPGLEMASQWLIQESLRLAIGPPIFFVISGYCIASSLDSLQRKGKSSKVFLARRFWRTFPPYWVALFGFAVITLLLDHIESSWLYQGPFGLCLTSPVGMDWSQWLGNLGLCETWRWHFFGSSKRLLVEVSWSLAYQEQFYVVCFALAWFFGRHLYKSLIWLSLGVLMLQLVASDLGASHRLVGLFPDLWHEFAVGLAVYWRLNVAESPRSKRMIDAALGLMLLVGVISGPRSTLWASGFGLLLIGLRRRDARLNSFAWLEPIRMCGQRSYSIYLAHIPVLALGSATAWRLGIRSFWEQTLIVIPLLSIAGIAAGWAFYRFVESRFTDLPKWPPFRLPKLDWRSIAPGASGPRLQGYSE